MELHEPIELLLITCVTDVGECGADTSLDEVDGVGEFFGDDLEGEKSEGGDEGV
jgi:hypothetical protein